MYLLEGYAIGLGMIIFIGPVFFLLLNSSIQYGFKAAVAVALGIIFSDIVCVALCYFGLSSFILVQQYQFWIGSIGSILLFVMGVSYVLKKVSPTILFSIEPKRLSDFFLKGFGINFFNPFVFVVWIGVYNYGKYAYPEDRMLLIFISAVLAGILTTDLLKVFLSKKVKRFVSLQRLTLLFKITGCILILFSIRLLYFIW